MTRILIVCTGNVCRSPMAEGVLRSLVAREAWGDRVDVRSAGTWAAPGAAASANAVKVAGSAGVDIENHRSTPLTRSLIQGADLILCMEPAHVEEIVHADPAAAAKTFLLTLYADAEDGARTGVDDPIGGTEPEYLKTYREIEGLLRQSLPRIAALVRETSPDTVSE